MADNKLLQQMLEHLVNDDQAKAEELFHEYVVTASREIYESLIDSEIAEEEKEDEEMDEAAKDDDAEDASTASKLKIKPLSEEELRNRNREIKRKEAVRLVRVNITCMNSNKREWQGEIFTVSGKAFGTLRRFIPFGVDWHVPQVMLNMIKERQCTMYSSKKTKTGETSIQRLVPEFGINYLNPLNKKELDNLAREQALAKGQSKE